MKIAMIGQKGLPAQSGGIEKHVEELSTRLVQAGHEVFVFTRPNYTEKSLKNYQGIKLISLLSINSKHLDAISHTFLATLKVIFSRKYDVVHYHGIGPSSLIWLVKLFRPGLPVVSTFHCQDYYHQKWGKLAQIYLKIGEYMCCKLPDKVITVSQGLKDYTEKKYQRQAVYVPNGVNIYPAREAKNIQEKWGLLPGEYILSVSRLVRHKGIHHLIKAYQDLETSKKLVIVGESVFTDDYTREIKKMAESGPGIIFTGKQIGEVLQELYSNAYLFVQPSESEGLSIALLEAMSYGLPAVVSNIPENLEAAGEESISFQSGDPKDLEKKLKHALENPEELKTKGEKEKERIGREYNWENITSETISLYQSMLK
mgnify:CR=1 FL=1